MKSLFYRIKDGIFTELVQGLSDAIPRIVTALVILMIGRLLALIVRKVVQRVLTALQVDRWGARMNDIDLVQSTGVRFELSKFIGQAVYYFIMLCVIIMATDILGIPIVTDMVRGLFSYLPALASALIVFLIGLFLADMVRTLVYTILKSMKVMAARAISTGIFYFLFITVAVTALGQAKLQTGFISSNLTVIIGAIAAAFAIGYGIASRDLMANYLAGYYNRDKVRIGDEVEIIGVRGKVVTMDATSLILQTDDRAIIIPLAKLTTERIEIIYPDPNEENKRIESKMG
jgi:small-conductance mechanosensitive channel